MLAAVFSRAGDPLQVVKLAKASIPTPSQSQLLLRILAAPINPSDINQIQGVYPVKACPTPLGLVPGNEGVAEVLETNDSLNFKQGDWVIFTKAGFGTWRSHAVAEPSQLMKIDREGLEPAMAATVSVNPCTAYRMLKDSSLKQGQVLVQNAANSGVGKCVIQLAKLFNFKTVNIVRDRPEFQSLKEQLENLGADLVVTEQEAANGEFTERIVDQLGQKPRLALNCVGGKSAVNMARLLESDSEMITFGAMSRQPLTIPNSLLIFKNIKFKGFWMTRWYSMNDRQEMTETLLDYYRNGQLKLDYTLNSIDSCEKLLNAIENYSKSKQILCF